ncbi:DUF5954 family protein [Streptomyces albipurpureus]|uniref:DUF5954 family protein n=1 Tax=Streptomyces albipurpureus TaxID=2897419 RepID=A0ABT0UIS6_9ACTN|nr:DUF5954 family protein [Streptomyces sp. CWNU-1]MCM2388231.1 DUF5954 family protein [Streptomyces sp. CWNU-1]
MEQKDLGPREVWPMVVQLPVGMVEAAVEADASDAAARFDDLALRGPRFGVAAQAPGEGYRWQVVVAVTAGYPQEARDSLNSLLWSRAKDEAKDREERRSLLAAVARLESERVDDLTAAGSRYRIIRAEEYAVTSADGMEPPRPTDPEPLVCDWTDGPEPEVDSGLVLDPGAPVTPTQAAERLALRDLCYAGDRFPDAVKEDARRALETHPNILLLPATFTLVERTRTGWRPLSGPHVTAHTARKSLDFSLTWYLPRRQGLLPADADSPLGVRAVEVEEDGDASVPELAPYVEAARELRAGRVNQLEFQGTLYEIARTRRLLRWGPDGPEGPRPTDVNSHDPDRIHPPLSEDGAILPED